MHPLPGALNVWAASLPFNFKLELAGVGVSMPVTMVLEHPAATAIRGLRSAAEKANAKVMRAEIGFVNILLLL
jgi:hypothetical protein